MISASGDGAVDLFDRADESLVMSRRSYKSPTSKKAGRPVTHQQPHRKPAGKQRLQRLLASAGFGSRRQCETLIEAGRVEVDGISVTKLGTTVDPSLNKIHVDGVELRKQKLVYYAVNKPVGFVTTHADPQGRSRVIDLVPRSERVFPVGRLDRNSEGLILLTNDGDLAQQLAHPRYGVRKIYRVTVAGKVDGETMKQMRRGIFIAEGRVNVEGGRILKSRSRSTELEIVLREGKNREIRRILARLGHKVQHLRRIAVGPLRLGDLPAGAYRPLTRTEIQKLKAVVDRTGERRPDRGKAKSTRKVGRKKATAKSQGRISRSAEQLDVQRPRKRGAVIGADQAEQDESRPTQKPGRKRSTKKRSAAKRSTKAAGKSAGRRSKKSKAKQASKAGRRGSTRKTTTKRAHQKRKSTKKGKRPKS